MIGAGLLLLAQGVTALADPVADAALDCAAGRILLGAGPEVVGPLVGIAIAREGAATGEFSERLVPRLQAELEARLQANANRSEGELAALCPEAM